MAAWAFATALCFFAEASGDAASASFDIAFGAFSFFCLDVSALLGDVPDLVFCSDLEGALPASFVAFSEDISLDDFASILAFTFVRPLFAVCLLCVSCNSACSVVHMFITAYDLQGRHFSAAATSSFFFLVPRNLIIPRSVAGKASLQPMERIAM